MSVQGETDLLVSELPADLVEVPAERPAKSALTIATVNPAEFRAAIRDYYALQEALDEALPDSTMQLEGKLYRKKSYWQAVSTAFRIDVVLVQERYVTLPDGDWGWLVIYRATAGDGRRRDGDGSCFRSERVVYKRDYENGFFSKKYQRKIFPIMRDPVTDEPIVDKLKTLEAASMHNIRALAHTRASNRAISNAVGFGEVSVEELPERPVDDEDSNPAKGGAKPSEHKKKATERARQETTEKPKEEEKPSKDWTDNPLEGPPTSELVGAHNMAHTEWFKMDNDAQRKAGAISFKQCGFLYGKAKSKGYGLDQILGSAQKRWPGDGIYQIWQLTKEQARILIDALDQAPEQT